MRTWEVEGERRRRRAEKVRLRFWVDVSRRILNLKIILFLHFLLMKRKKRLPFNSNPRFLLDLHDVTGSSKQPS